MRLIDADLLMRKCEKWLKPKAPDEDEMVSLADIAVSMLMEIKEQPTAYDVDKVVKQLDEKSFFVATSKEFYDNPQDGKNVSDVIEISDAIEIVKGGGVEK